MKILIIGTRFAPIPSVCGGAIESLIDEYLKYNSKTRKNEITVYSFYANELSNFNLKEYSNVNFRFIDGRIKKYKFLRIYCGIIRKLLKNKFGDEFIRMVRLDLKEKNELNYYDKIVILNNINNITYICNNIGGEHVLYLHNDYLNIDTPNCHNILNKLDKVWCVSRYIKERVDMIKSNTKTSVLYNGINLNEFVGEVDSKELKDLKNKYTIDDNDFVILYTGRIMKEKGVKELISAYKKFRCGKDNTKLLILGGPTDISVEYFNDLKQECKDYENEIFFFGKVSHDIFKLVYKIASVQVVPSMWNEAFGLTVVEGMSAGVPMIVSDSGGMLEIVEENCALVVSRENILEELVDSLNKVYYNDNHFCKVMTQNASKKVQNYSSQLFFENIESLMLEKR